MRYSRIGNYVFSLSLVCAIVSLIFVGSKASFGVQIEDSVCAELDVVVAALMEDPLVQQYQNDDCSVVELLVQREIVGTSEIKCVKGFKDGNCVLPDFLEDTIASMTYDVLEDVLDDASDLTFEEDDTSEFFDSFFAEEDVYVPPIITYTPPAPSVPSNPSVSQPSENTAPQFTIPEVIYGVSTIDGTPTYTPTPLLASTVPVYDPGFSDTSDFDAFITVALLPDDTIQIDEGEDFEISSVSEESVRNALQEYRDSNQATDTQKSALIAQLQSSQEVDNKDAIQDDEVREREENTENNKELNTENNKELEPLEEQEVLDESLIQKKTYDLPTLNLDDEGNPTVLVQLDDDVEILEGELFVFTHDVEDDELLEQVKMDIIQEFGSDIEYIEKIFPDTNLTNDLVIKYNTDRLTYVDLVDYLDSKDVYVTQSESKLLAQPGVLFGHSSVSGFSFPSGQDILSWFKKDTSEEAVFGVQSVGDLSQWHLEYVGYNNIASCVQTGRPVKVAIVDNGFDIMHEDLDEKVVAMYDEADKDNDIQVPNYKKEWNHGTKEAGLVGAEHNDVGVNGIFPNSELILVKSTKDTANGKDITNGIEAIAKAYELGADVINLSRGGYGNVPILEKVTKAVADKGVYLVAAAGNYNKNERFYPAAYDWVISVAAIDNEGAKANFSNYGPWVDISAPGVDMLTTDLDNTYEEFNGTSEAAPLVAGALGLALSYGLDRNDIKDNVYPIRNENLGSGILDLRFMCELIPEDYQYVAPQEPTHNSGGSSLGGMSTGTLIMILGGAMVLLGLLGGIMSYLGGRRKH